MSCPRSSFYFRPTENVARDLVGKTLIRVIKKYGKSFILAGRIVEAEAYGYIEDEASHARMGPTVRNAIMFGDVGIAYVYFTYGNHFCLNVSARSRKVNAGAVLIRAIEPVAGIDLMKQFRSVANIYCLSSGPGKLTQALNITSALNGADMTDSRSDIRIEIGIKPRHIIATRRIGITRSAEKSWRFVDPSSAFVSRKVHNQVMMTRQQARA